MKRFLAALLALCLLAGALFAAASEEAGEALVLLQDGEAGASPDEGVGEIGLSLEEWVDAEACPAGADDVDLEQEAEAGALEHNAVSVDEAAELSALIDPDPEAVYSFEPAREYSCIDSSRDSDELFAAYVDRILYSRRLPASNAVDYARERLEGNDRVIYDRLKAEILKVAAGERASTLFEIPASALLGGDRITAGELGVDASAGLTSEVMNQMQSALRARYAFKLDTVANALWFDCPYELYWLDRYGVGISVSLPRTLISYDREGGDYFAYVSEGVTFSFPVLERYAGEEDCTVDVSLIQSARQAAENARAIVGKYAGYSDFARLYGYAKEICDLVSYNNAAASNEWDDANQDPWKLIWVFDGDESTDVVCEGYAQAFQYLCELTDFEGGVRCVLVTGSLDGNRNALHSWNLVRMEDGKNYAVDVTWLDTEGSRYALHDLEGSMADWISQEKGGLFLCGGEGSVGEGYTIRYRTGSATSTRSYLSDTLNTFSESALTLAAGKYVPTGWQTIGGKLYYFDAEGRYLTGTQALNGEYYRFDEASGALLGVPSGWQTVDGRRYFFEADGTLHTSHTLVAEPGRAATCTEAGLTDGTRCAVCGVALKERTSIPAKGHTPATDAAVAATCTEAGKTEGSHCATCGLALVAQKIVPAKGHAPVADPGRAATCTEAGLSEGSHCATCGLVLTAQKAVPAKGHTPVVDAAVAPTYTKKGLTAGSHCAVCGAVLVKQQVVPVLDCTFHMKKSATKAVNLGDPIQIAVDGQAVKSYKSSDKKVATVTAKGRVATKKAGTAKITITLKSKKTLTLTVKVVDPNAPKSVKITQGKSATLKVGKKLALAATLSPTGSKSALKWSTSNKKVATVSSKGVVTAKKKGTAKITVTTDNGKKATIKITVKK